jgi:LmbE family N-acetylglucosaminyl deacetylase
MKIPRKTDKILILAPHPDDEIMAAGGYIYTALKNKAKIKIIIVTHGESFGYAAGRKLDNFLPIPEKCLEFGQIRQKEAVKSLADLDLDRDNIIFLGFPDKGLSSLWKKNWSKDRPYHSPLLKTTSSPFREIYKPKVVFAGEVLLNLLEEILRKFKPNIIIFSSCQDDHPDHKALFNFSQKMVRNNLAKLNNPYLYSFLIHKHKFMYPLPYGFHPDKALNPPPSFKKNTNWQKFPLCEKAILAKEKAILSYETQVIAIKKRLLSFLRRNELFKKLDLTG